LEVPRPGGSFQALLVSAAETSELQPGVLLVPEAYGANPHNRELAERFARAGFAVLLPDLYYYRAGPWQAYDYSEHEHVNAIRDALDHEVVLADLQAALETFGGLPGVDRQRVAFCGFSIGGRLAHVAASRESFPVQATAFFYQCAGADGPIPCCPTIGLFAGQYRPLPAESVGRLDSRLRQSSSFEHEAYVYPDAQYGFLRYGAPSFHYGAAADAWHRVLSFFERKLNGSGDRTTS